VSDSHPKQVDAAPTERVDTAFIPIDINTQVGSLEQRVRNLEAQQMWLHLEQLRAEVGGLRQMVDWLIEYAVERDGSAVGRIDHVADSA
jgi:hypothetical protein